MRSNVGRAVKMCLMREKLKTKKLLKIARHNVCLELTKKQEIIYKLRGICKSGYMSISDPVN